MISFLFTFFAQLTLKNKDRFIPFAIVSGVVKMSISCFTPLTTFSSLAQW